MTDCNLNIANVPGYRNNKDNFTNQVHYFNVTNVNNTDSFSSQGKNVNSLYSKLEEAQNEQGCIGKLWDSFKNLTGLGFSSKDVKEKISQFEQGNITYDEALSSIEKYKTKQNNMVDLVANTVSGVVTGAIAVSGIVTGGLSVAGIAIGAAIGGALKSGIKTADRATNNIEGDALDAKQIAKDTVTGAVDGAVNVATAGMFNGIAKSGQSVGKAVIKGVEAGAASGAISGAAAGAASYTVDAALEDDVDFTLSDFAQSTAQNAAAGAVMGGIMGGVTQGISQNNMNKSAASKPNVNTEAADIKTRTDLTDETTLHQAENVKNTEPVEIKTDTHLEHTDAKSNVKTENADIRQAKPKEPELTTDTKASTSIKPEPALDTDTHINANTESKPVANTDIQTASGTKTNHAIDSDMLATDSVNPQNTGNGDTLKAKPLSTPADEATLQQAETIKNTESTEIKTTKQMKEANKNASSVIIEETQAQTQSLKQRHIPQQVKCDTQQITELVDALNIEKYDKNISKTITMFITDPDNADLNIDELTLYLKNIDFNEIKKMAPNFPDSPQARLNFAVYHYNNGTVDFTPESLTFSQKLTDYFKTNSVSAQELDDILTSQPLTSRQIGTIPEDWLTKASSNAKTQEQIYDAISIFNADRNTENLSDNLSKILNKRANIQEIGKGEYGTCYKISIEDAKDTCLKVFHGEENTRSLYVRDAYDISACINQGPYHEPQTAIFLNEYSNDFVKMHFGQVSPIGENTSFMITDYLSDDCTPLNIKPKKFNGKIVLRDGDINDSRNAKNGKILDFGGVEIFQHYGQ